MDNDDLEHARRERMSECGCESEINPANLQIIVELRILKKHIEEDDGDERYPISDYFDLVQVQPRENDKSCRISRGTAIVLLRLNLLPKQWNIMCKEYGQDQEGLDEEDWVGMMVEDFEGDDADIPSEWQTFEIWV